MTKNNSAITTVIEQNPLFDTWPAWAREALAQVAFIRQYRRGRKIMGAGEIPHAFILLKGAVFAGWHCHDGKDFFHLAPGFGEAINLAPALANIPL
ncbi:MAG: hypothetical protein LBQ81_12580, partial [Zoogloeaceae bacterium]|nr:hypothetical protein [Zoogloeaceae bacterium]